MKIEAAPCPHCGTDDHIGFCVTSPRRALWARCWNCGLESGRVPDPEISATASDEEVEAAENAALTLWNQVAQPATTQKQISTQRGANGDSQGAELD